MSNSRQKSHTPIIYNINTFDFRNINKFIVSKGARAFKEDGIQSNTPLQQDVQAI